MYQFYNLQAQAKTNLRNLKQITQNCDFSFCFVQNKLNRLYEMIVQYRNFYKSVKPGDDFSQIDSNFEKLRKEIFACNMKCNDAILSRKNICLENE